MVSKIRYLYEHDFLPRGFYESKAVFVDIFTRDPIKFFSIFNSMLNDHNVSNPYYPSEFNVEQKGVSNDIFCLKFTCPEPHIAPECYYIYCFFDIAFMNMAFYTVEKMDESLKLFESELNQNGNGNSVMLCSWDENGVHGNYGMRLLEEHVIFDECVKLFQEKINNKR